VIGPELQVRIYTTIEYPRRKKNYSYEFPWGPRFIISEIPQGGARPLENFLGEGVYSTEFSMGRAKKERGSSTGGIRIKIAIAQF
jgi:hypothetical protein